MTEQVTDWRGTPIIPGALVIYGAPVGRSIAMVEAEVVGFTKSGRVNVKVIRRAYGSWGEMKEVVHVGADRLTIVEKLPPTEVPTEKEKEAIRQAERAERDRIEATHRFTLGDNWYNRRCAKCGYGQQEYASWYECPGN